MEDRARLLAAVADECASITDGMFELAEEFRNRESDETEVPVAALLAAFHYVLFEATYAEGRRRFGPFGPFVEFGGAVFPPPLQSIPRDWTATWSSVVAHSEHPAVVSRLHDLLWVTRSGDRAYAHGLEAIDAYLALAPSRSALEEALVLARAVELSKELNQRDRHDRARDAVLEAYSRSLEIEEPAPGVALRHLQTLVSLRQPPSNVADLIERGVTVYQADVHTVEAALDLLAFQNRSDQTQVRLVRARQVDAWRTAGRNGSGIQKLACLEHALELAARHGLSETAEELRVELQQIAPAALNLQRFELGSMIATEPVRAEIEWCIGTDGWEDALTRFGELGPPSGEPLDNVRRIEEQRREFPLQYAVRASLRSPEGFALRTVRTETEQTEAALSARETQRVLRWGQLVGAPALREVATRYGRPSIEELSSFFRTSLIGPTVARRLAHGLVRYWDEEWDCSASVVVPRLEAVIREVARAAGLAIFDEPGKNGVGGVRSLGIVLSQLEGRLNEAWRRYLRCLLCDPIGINLRNRIAHGIIDEASPVESALLLHSACYLRRLEIDSSET